MSTWLVNGVFTLVAVLACTGLFFFVATRGKLIWSGLTGAQGADAHVYPLYSTCS